MATAEEGKQLRESAVKKDILVLGGILEDEVECFNKYNLIPVISDFEGLKLTKYLKNKTIHLKFDTGMHRLGFYENEIDKVFQFIEKNNIKIEGLMSHFPSADIDKEFTKRQIQNFKVIVDKLKKLNPKYVHLQNSAGLIYDCPYCNLVRIGLAMYGEKPVNNFPVNIENSMYIKSKLISIKNVKKGDKISYCGTFQTNKDMKIGIISFGYADGLPRSLSNKGYVLINGKKAYIIGNITMDMTIVNLDNIDAKVGDEVVIIGKQKNEEITFSNVANLTDTIPYEIMCGISKRVKRLEK